MKISIYQTLNDICNFLWVGCHNIGEPLTDFTYMSVKVRMLSMRIDLILMKTRIVQGRNMVAK